MKISGATPQNTAAYYDREMDFIDLAERAEVKVQALLVLDCIAKADGYISGPEIRRQVNIDVRCWDAIIALLCESIETKFGAVTRYKIHEMREKTPCSRQFSLAKHPESRPHADSIYKLENK